MAQIRLATQAPFDFRNLSDWQCQKRRFQQFREASGRARIEAGHIGVAVVWVLVRQSNSYSLLARRKNSQLLRHMIWCHLWVFPHVPHARRSPVPESTNKPSSGIFEWDSDLFKLICKYCEIAQILVRQAPDLPDRLLCLWVNTLLYCMGEQAEAVLASTNATADNRKTYTTVLAKFDTLF